MTHDGKSDADEVTKITVLFCAKTFALDAIKKAAYRFSDRASFDIRQSNGEIQCRLSLPVALKQNAADALVSELRNEVLDQDLRQHIYAETEPVRNAVLAYAFSRSGLEP